MKKILLPATICFCLAAFNVQAQVNDPNQVAKDNAANHANNDMDNAANKGLDKAEQGIGNLFKKKNKDKKQDPSSSSNQQTVQNNQSNNNSSNGGQSASLKTYTNYDFVPGDKIIFNSELTDEKTGEIPSQFALGEGQMDIQSEDGQNVIRIPKGDGATFTPRMTSQAYMPDQFTVEFDFKNERFGLAHVNINFGQGDGMIKEINFGNGDGLAWTTGDVAYPDQLQVGTDQAMTWHHIAIAINKNAGKIYIDQFRVANVNNLEGKAKSVNFVIAGYETSFIKNIRIAAGGIDIYKKITTDAKIITHGILFDVDKSTLKPESMGTINQIYNLLKQDASLKFEIDGHTDNSGNSQHNIQLSQQRADAVKAQLVSMGIDASRLSTKGFGDTKPISDNNTPEGKENNRRVEFVKI